MMAEGEATWKGMTAEESATLGKFMKESVITTTTHRYRLDPGQSYVHAGDEGQGPGVLDAEGPRPRSPDSSMPAGRAGLNGASRALSYRFAKSSVAWTSALRMPGSMMLWPAPGTITSLDPGQRLCSAHALAAGHTTS